MAMRSVSAAIDRALGKSALCFSRGSPILKPQGQLLRARQATLLARGLSIDLPG